MEHVDVLIVGAGLSGIGAARYLETECPWATYAIFEARGSVGGTWDLFRYPGIRSDSDMFTLGYSFKPWDGEKAIAEGGSILDYIRRTATEAGIDKHIRFHHRIVSANWSTDAARWHVVAERSDAANPGRAAERVELTAGFLFSCAGYYRYDHGYTPDFAGIERFQGTVVHPQAWPAGLDYAGKRVVVIGSGATAITLVPRMAETAAHVTMLQRSPTYVVSLPDTNGIANLMRRLVPVPATGRSVRWMNALITQGFYELCRKQPALMKRVLLAEIRRQLPKGYDVGKHFTPRYAPWDQRLCVVTNGDLFSAIRSGKASVVTDHIDTFTDRGIRLKSGAELEADIVVTATGLELLFMGGIELSVDGAHVDAPKRLAYKGMMLEGVPNFAMAVGYTNASWTLKCDLTCGYVCRLLNHLRSSGLKQCVPVNRDPSIGAEPLLNLNSGYVTRAVDRMPKQGTKFPWQVYQSYLRDYRALKLSRVTDDSLEFS
jgi:monooxygenase